MIFKPYNIVECKFFVYKRSAEMHTKFMKYFEDEDYIKKQLFDANSDEVNKLLKRFFVVKSETKNK